MSRERIDAAAAATARALGFRKSAASLVKDDPPVNGCGVIMDRRSWASDVRAAIRDLEMALSEIDGDWPTRADYEAV